MTTELVFTAKANTLPVVVDEVNYELREMNAGDRDKHLDQLSARTNFSADGRPLNLKKFDSLQADLVHLCLYDAEGKRVEKSAIQKWPAGVVSKLHKAAQELNHLGGEGTPPDETIKNA